MEQFRISKNPPPNYEEIVKRFDIKIKFESGLVFSYYPNIHVNNGRLDPALLRHELTHWNRQKEITPEVWWKNYLDDENFRLVEELMAYRVQYEYVKKHMPPRTHYFNLKFFAESLADPHIYGLKDMSVIKAMNLIQRK